MEREHMMVALGILGIIILVGGLFVTIQVAGKGDQDYHKETKGNVTRLTYIYIALFLVIIAGFFIYLKWFV
jgi:heme/copper-type cytochrome/quinol oxidase subunit 2